MTADATVATAGAAQRASGAAFSEFDRSAASDVVRADHSATAAPGGGAAIGLTNTRVSAFRLTCSPND